MLVVNRIERRKKPVHEPRNERDGSAAAMAVPVWGNRHGAARADVVRNAECAAGKTLDIGMRGIAAEQLDRGWPKRHVVRREQFNRFVPPDRGAGGAELFELVERRIELAEHRGRPFVIGHGAQRGKSLSHRAVAIARIRHQLEERIGAQQPIAQSEPRAQRGDIVRIEVELEKRRQLDFTVAALGTRIALDLHRAALEVRRHTDLGQSGFDLASPRGVRHGDEHIARRGAGSEALPYRPGNESEFRFGAIEHDALSRRNPSLGFEHKRRIARCRELVETIEMRIRLLGVRDGQRASHGDEARRGKVADKALRCLAQRTVIVDDERNGFGLDTRTDKPAIRHRRYLAGKKRLAHIEVFEEDRVHGLLLGSNEPALVLIGRIAYAFVEEFEHLAQPARLEPAHFHVFHEHVVLVFVEHPRTASDGTLHARVGHGFEGEFASGHHRIAAKLTGGRHRIAAEPMMRGKRRAVTSSRYVIGAHDASGRTVVNEVGCLCDEGADYVVGRTAFDAQACAVFLLKQGLRQLFD